MHVRLKQPHFPRRAAQKGVVLLVALIFLVLLTLLAIGASSGSLLQQRMVSATRSAQLATMSADTALRGAEWQLWSSASNAGSTFACGAAVIDSTTGCIKYDPESTAYASDGTVTAFRTGNNSWLAGAGIAYLGTGGSGYTTGLGTANIAENPQYIIEDMGLVLPPGAGPQHESGVTGPNNAGPGQISLHIYRITARATGGNQNTVRVVQSTFDAQTGN
ncbi:MAG: pilus assembly PilX family protein [Rhodanobacteraceae bacterium]